MSENRYQRYRLRAQQFGARTVLFQQAAAGQLGLSTTELEIFRLVQHEGMVTASELAKQTGLTPASMSAIVDKLANQGFLTREQDRNDRRRWLLEAAPEAVEKVDAIFAVHARRTRKLLATYSDKEFDVILEFLRLLADELKVTAVELGNGANIAIHHVDDQDNASTDVQGSVTA